MITRQDLKERLFPAGMPELSCPPIVHYRKDGSFDQTRIEAHLRLISASVKSFLLFGSTGDGWVLSEQQKDDLLLFTLDLARKYDFRILIGTLKKDSGQVLASIRKTNRMIQEYSGRDDLLEAMCACHVCGYTICAPTGKDLAQDQILAELRLILQTGVPVALYQLPQVTQNEISAQSLSRLAGEYPNFYFFKDTSGEDRVARSGLDFQGVFLVRGAEGDYEKWFCANQGPYDGFLLSSANCFAQELQEVIGLLRAGQAAKAKTLSARLSLVIEQVFGRVSSLKSGNAFANGNKCIDHILAFGDQWPDHPAPVLYTGESMPRSCLEFAASVLAQQGFFRKQGYFLTDNR
jgi:4-hydroxy-tetrahydrodipicolinate synthase